MKISSVAFSTLLVGAVLTAGCHSDNDSTGVANAPAPETAQVRFIHTSPDAPDVNVVGAESTLVTQLRYKEASPFQTFPANASLNVRVDGMLPGGAVTVIGPVDLALEPDTSYSVIVLGEVASLDTLLIAEPTSSVPAGSVRAQVVHGAPNAPEVDVYVTAPGALLAQEVPLGTFEFSEDLGPVTVPSGDYQIRVTLPSDPDTVVFDSGTVALPGGADLLITAVKNTATGEAPISLVVADGSGSFEILDAATPAELRVIHASPDAPAVDVIVNDNFAHPVLSGVPYPAFSDYLAVPPGTYNVKVTPADNPGVIVIDADLEVEAGKRYSAYASDVLATISPFVLVDDNRAVATQAKVRIVHMAPGAGLVDIYVTAPGADIAALSPAFAGVDFRDETGYVSLEAGSYDVTVAVAGTKTAAIGPATVAVTNGGVYTAAARDAVGGGAPFGVILLDDFNP